MSRNLNDLLKWSIENTTRSEDAPAAPTASAAPANTVSNLDPALIEALLGGPSDAELMKAAMEVITSPDPTVGHSARVTAFDNFEQLVESLDNANNLANLSLWAPLVSLLDHDHPDLRRYAAWCVGTAVQNNAPSQERLVAAGGAIPRLVRMAADADAEPDAEVRKKAVYALSSAVRNYQPAMDVAHRELGKLGLGFGDRVDATDMDAVDRIIRTLRQRLAAA